jgi:hypothetical protein
VQESNIFNEKSLSVLKCVDLLNKVIFLLNQVTRLCYPLTLSFFQGEEFAGNEKSSVFFNVTKLFQVNTPATQSLRRLMYVFIKVRIYPSLPSWYISIPRGVGFFHNISGKKDSLTEYTNAML